MNSLEKKFNFGVVSAGRIYRSRQPDKEFLEYLKKKYNIKTIVVLRTNLDESEKEFCQNNGIQLIKLPVKRWRRWPEPKGIQDFFRLLDKRDCCPVLVHCWHGKDRTSALIALYRLGYENWKFKEAINEMKHWKANWLCRLFIRTHVYKILAGLEEKNTS